MVLTWRGLAVAPLTTASSTAAQTEGCSTQSRGCCTAGQPAVQLYSLYQTAWAHGQVKVTVGCSCKTAASPIHQFPFQTITTATAAAPTDASPTSAVCAASLQDFGLHNFASDFADAGLSAFVFDYRGWGGSGGEIKGREAGRVKAVCVWHMQVANASAVQIASDAWCQPIASILPHTRSQVTRVTPRV